MRSRIGLLRIVGIPLVVFCIALIASGKAQALVCELKTKKGVIKRITIRDKCAKKEIAVPASPLLQQGPHVTDSGGNEVGAFLGGEQVLRQIGSQVVEFSVNTKGVDTPLADSRYQFVYQGTQCSGAPYNGDLSGVGDNDLIVSVSASADGKTGYYVMDSEKVKLSGDLSQAYFRSQCATPPATLVNAMCDTGDTPLGSASSCDPKRLGYDDPLVQCSCISCCSTFTVTSPSVEETNPVHTVDLSGVGTPPFKVER